MSKLKITFDASRVVARLKSYADDVSDVMKAEWPQVIQECIEDILLRAPSPEEEFAYLMGENSTGFTGGSAQGPAFKASKSGNPSKRFSGHGSGVEGDRIQFTRTPGRWIQELVKLPNSYVERTTATSFFLGLGNVPFLEENSKFSWQNVDGSGTTHVHTSEYGTWSFFEYGQSHYIRPRNYPGSSQGNGLGHKLYVSQSEKYWAMTKSYPKLAMYSDFNTSIFLEAVTKRIRTVKF